MGLSAHPPEPPHRQSGARPLLTLLAASAVIYAVNLQSAESRASFGVQATVMPQASLRLEHGDTDIEISAIDLQRGYIESAQPLRLQVSSNSPQGFALDLIPVGNWVSSVTVRGLGQDVMLQGEGGSIVERWSRPQATTTLALSFRFTLSPGLRAGRYPYPLRLAARALESPPPSEVSLAQNVAVSTSP